MTGIVLAIAMAAAVFFAATWGYMRMTAAGGQLSLPGGGGSVLSDRTALAAFIAVAGTGLLAGILIGVPRVSPLAAGLPGLLLLGLTAQYVISVRLGTALVPLRSYPFGAGLAAMLSRGLLGAAGLMMIIPIFVPSRWRGRRRAAAPAADEASEPVSVPDDSPESPEPAVHDAYAAAASATRTGGYPAAPATRTAGYPAEPVRQGPAQPTARRSYLTR